MFIHNNDICIYIYIYMYIYIYIGNKPNTLNQTTARSTISLKHPNLTNSVFKEHFGNELEWSDEFEDSENDSYVEK